ncbi:hypothetical protein RRG08_012756 [Elysia crispata]|uniref:Uncharacterized protein n=1 Tax=Elysia crispata TaxID=231223 RepID=A0AAE1DZW8_9GAST|nr:hypothetical protein RRG08_012756 [Elysia crispata]
MADEPLPDDVASRQKSRRRQESSRIGAQKMAVLFTSFYSPKLSKIRPGRVHSSNRQISGVSQNQHKD